MRQTIGFLFFMLFLGGFALVTLKNLGSSEAVRDANSANDDISIVSGAWADTAASTEISQKPFVRFHADGKISGFAGCNRFFGSFVATDSSLEVAALGATRMACPEDVMGRERAFLRSVESATGYTITARVLTLTADDGATSQLEFDVLGDN